MANSLGSDVTIKVTPETLYAKSQSISSLLTRVQGHFEELGSAVGRTGGYWIGEAGDVHRSMYQEMEPHIDEIARRLREHIRDLNEIAGVYEAAEKEIQSAAEQLPSDVIF